MKNTVLGAVVFFSLLALAGLSVYIYAERTGSGQRLREFNQAAGFLEARIGALEKQRDLLGETAVALDGQAATLLSQAENLRQHSAALDRRVQQIDLEITNMRDLIGGARESVRSPRFSMRGFRLTAGSGFVIIAILAFIWLLYTSLRSRADEEDAFLADVGRGIEEPDETALEPGSVLEEEFPAAAQQEKESPSGEEDDPSPSHVEKQAAADDADEGTPAAEDEESDPPPESDVAEEQPEKKGEPQ